MGTPVVSEATPRGGPHKASTHIIAHPYIDHNEFGWIADGCRIVAVENLWILYEMTAIVPFWVRLIKIYAAVYVYVCRLCEARPAPCTTRRKDVRRYTLSKAGHTELYHYLRGTKHSGIPSIERMCTFIKSGTVFTVQTDDILENFV